MIVDNFFFCAFLLVVYVSQPSAFWPMSDWSLWYFPKPNFRVPDSITNFQHAPAEEPIFEQQKPNSDINNIQKI